MQAIMRIFDICIFLDTSRKNESQPRTSIAVESGYAHRAVAAAVAT
jgi:hypothetical protein